MSHVVMSISLISIKTRFNLDVFCLQELEHQVTLINKVAKEVFTETGLTLPYKVGTMIEIPRAALVADEVHGIFFA